jgi:hypothetical protein
VATTTVKCATKRHCATRRGCIDVRLKYMCIHSPVELSLVYRSSILGGIHFIHHQNYRQRLTVRKLDVPIDI